ncbi:CaiB/BaiF CoA-transferase family protein [Cupriavidus sp. D384]|uniref:CaiB/BaiF CoA transferase family protein n=1 Tax=Cupriavidus sp. D384 TaxID=1538095 RepID=UPI0009ED6AA1|nr:CoA transferase [Cupriavidus sp. D384]
MEKQLQYGALTALRVLDASRVLGGPLSGQILADHGADVLKVEGPEGDDTRQWGPPYLGSNSAYFSGANRNKTNTVLNLRDAEDRAKFLALVDESDVLIENFKPSTLQGWGWNLETFLQRNPRLIHCRVSGFGADGPYGGLPAYDTAVQALCGLMSVNGDETSGPLRVGLPVVDMTTGLNATIGILLALQARTQTGRGQLVETTLYANAISLLHPHAGNFLSTGNCPQPTGNAHPNIYPYDRFETATGPIYLAVGNDTQFRTLCSELDLEDVALEEHFATNPARSVNRGVLRVVLRAALSVRDGRALVDVLVRKGVPCAPISSVEEALQDPHTAHMGLLVEMAGGYKGVASPIMLSETPPTYRMPPPTL